MSGPKDEAGPLLRIVRGEPTSEELAALVAVLSARSASGPAKQPAPVSAWTDRSRLVRRCPPPAPSAWRNSAWRV